MRLESWVEKVDEFLNILFKFCKLKGKLNLFFFLTLGKIKPSQLFYFSEVLLYRTMIKLLKVILNLVFFFMDGLETINNLESFLNKPRKIV